MSRIKPFRSRDPGPDFPDYGGIPRMPTPEEYHRLKEKLARLERKLSEESKRTNPDRAGGYTDQEISSSYDGWSKEK